MRTLALTVAYDGTEWAGFQRQTRYPSIQRALESALTEVLQHPVRLDAAGRTDAGVHALAQVISLRTPNPLPLERLPWVANRLLPASIRIRRVCERPAGFHARRSAGYRRYWYIMQPTRWPDPLRGRYAWQLQQSVDPAAMQAALDPLVGYHDFVAFCHGGCRPGKTTVRTIQRAQVRSQCGRIIVDLQADAFLHRMVRLLVANLVAIGAGERPVSWLRTLLASGDRLLAGEGAPPCGLCLVRIGYPATLPPHAGCECGELYHEELPG